MSELPDGNGVGDGVVEGEIRPKPPLSREELRDVIDLTLWAGQLLLQNGADSSRVETTAHHFGTGLGCDWLDVFVSAHTIIITTISGEEFRTKIRRIVRFGGVDMGTLAAVNQLSRLVSSGVVDRHAARRRLEEIDRMRPSYPAWLTVLMTGVACAAFSRLFGGDWIVFAVTLAATVTGATVRLALQRGYFNNFLVVVVSAFVATAVAAVGVVADWSPQANIALAACVLFLVPGVPLVNAIEDLISGHTNVGIARGIGGALISLGIAIGIVFTLSLLGVTGGLPPATLPPTVWADALWAGVAALGFAMLFNVPPRTLLGAVLCAALGRSVRYALIDTGWGLISIIEVATLFAAMVVGFLGYQMARYWRVPASTFTVVGIIPMVPGTFAFGAMVAVLDVAGGAGSAESGALLTVAALNAIKTGLILTALAVGIVIPALLFQRQKPVV